MTAGVVWLFRRRRPVRDDQTRKPGGASSSAAERSANGWLDSADALRAGAEVVECGSDVGDALLHEFFDTVIEGPPAEDVTRH